MFDQEEPPLVFWLEGEFEVEESDRVDVLTVALLPLLVALGTVRELPLSSILLLLLLLLS